MPFDKTNPTGFLVEAATVLDALFLFEGSRRPLSFAIDIGQPDQFQGEHSLRMLLAYRLASMLVKGSLDSEQSELIRAEVSKLWFFDEYAERLYRVFIGRESAGIEGRGIMFAQTLFLALQEGAMLADVVLSNPGVLEFAMAVEGLPSVYMEFSKVYPDRSAETIADVERAVHSGFARAQQVYESGPLPNASPEDKSRFLKMFQL